MQNFRDFIQDLFTLRTVWIDKGRGQWAVKKRFHPLLRSMGWTIALIVCVGIYSSINTLPKSEAEAQPEVITARLPEPDRTIQTVQTLPDPEPKPEPAPKPKEIILPLKTVAKTTKTDIVLPSEKNPGTDRIISSVQTVQTAPKPQTKNNGKYSIQVNKSEYTLSLYKGSELVKTYPVAVGKNPGDKQRVGDNRTPTGDFRIVSIENASGWTHDFRDGKGKIAGAYGPWFLRLDAKGWKGIGIHGTHDPASRGTNATEGCIRLSNEDIAELRQYAYRNMPVSIREY